jgi:hypothetical protein
MGHPFKSYITVKTNTTVPFDLNLMVQYNAYTRADPDEDNPIEYERKRNGGGGRIIILHALF